MKNLTLIFALLLSSLSFAQRNSSSNMFWNTYTHFNPAMSGFEEKIHGNITYRNQYPSLSQSFHSVYVNANMRFGEHHGGGIAYTNENQFIWKRNQINLNYNYQFDLGEDSKLSIGVAGTYFNSKLDLSELTFGDEPEPNLNYNDINLNVGAAYRWKDLLVSASAANVFNSVLSPDPIYSYYHDYHVLYSVTAAYDFKLGKRFSLKPQVLGQYINGFSRLAFNTQLALDNKYWIGASYINRDQFSVMAGWNFYDKFRLAYSYDAVVSKLSNVFGGAHEVSIGFYLK